MIRIKPDFYSCSLCGRLITRNLTSNDLPVDPLRLAKEKHNIDIELRYEDLCGEEGYTFHNIKTNKYIIYIDDSMYYRRCNFTIAHEVAHILLKHYIKYNINALSTDDINALDREADTLAAEILMPKHIVERFCKQCINEIDLADEFEVSYSAMNVRLNYLGIKTYTVVI